MSKGNLNIPPNIVNYEGLAKLLQDVLSRLTEVENQLDALKQQVANG